MDDCAINVHGRGLCKKHYSKWRRANAAKCSIDNCENKIDSRQLCPKHYWRLRKYGDPLKVETFYAKTPDESFASRTRWEGDCLVWTGAKYRSGYGSIALGNNTPGYVHRYAWERENGPIPDDKVIDHQCWNKLCVRVDHLRLASKSQNSTYLSGADSNSSTGVRNVDPHGKKWRVALMKQGTTYRFGVFDTIDEAAEVAEQARKDLFGEFAGRG